MTNSIEKYIENIEFKIEKITPDWAKNVLERHFKRIESQEFRQRKLTESKVNQYAVDITHGSFLLTHQGIAFDSNNDLIDGQHRLMAVMQAKKPIWLTVSRGWPTGPIDAAGGLTVMDTIDRGRTRDLAQALNLSHGYSLVDAKVIGVAAKFIIDLVMTTSGLRHRQAVTPNQVLSVLKIYEPHLRAVAVHAKNFQRIPRRPYALLGFAHKSHPAEVDEFAKKFFSLVGLKDNDPALLLHRFTALQLGRRGAVTRANEYQVAAQLLRAHIDKRTVQMARPNPEALNWLVSQQDEAVDQIVDSVVGQSKQKGQNK